jgi:hypothetical protein
MVRLSTLTIVALITFLRAFAVAQNNAGETTALNSIIEALEKAQATVSLENSYQVIREYQLHGTNESTSNSDVIVELNVRPPVSEEYRIQSSSGSKRGEQVVRRVLEHELQAASSLHHDRTALNRDNYDFTYDGEAMVDGQACYVLGLRPKRREPDLMSGEARIDKHSFLVRQLEGDIAKSPSWWLKKVHVKLTFAEVSGTWLQTRMEAIAEVRVVGSHTLTSRILDYRGSAQVASANSAHRR